MKNEYKYLVKLTTADNEHTIIIGATNDIKECKRLADNTRAWLKEFNQKGVSKAFANALVHVSTAPKGSCYIH